MGQDIPHDRFDEAEYDSFSKRLEASLEALRAVVAWPNFGSGDCSIGAELELFLIDRDGFPLAANEEVLAKARDPRLSLELNRFNLECNARPNLLSGTPFQALGDEIADMVRIVSSTASALGGRVAMMGILPTLRDTHLGPAAMTDIARYRALAFGLRRLRRRPFSICIDGEDPLGLSWDDVTLEGANASLQLHLRVEQEKFVDTYNAAQLATAPVLAVSGNSPFFFGHRLWEETRVALFKQSVDSRESAQQGSQLPRVCFGDAWLEGSAVSLFESSVLQHPPLIPLMTQQNPLESVATGTLPHLRELRLHHGTVWTWNRAVYDPSDMGHIRLEHRSLPAGPTLIDMLANAAFFIGLTLGLRDDLPRMKAALDFNDVHHNFYRAAQWGLASELVWTDGRVRGCRRAMDLVPALIEVAAQGLDSVQLSRTETEPLLDIVANRAASGQTGAVWQRTTLARLEQRLGRDQAWTTLLEEYLALSNTGKPVHEWPNSGETP